MLTTDRLLLRDFVEADLAELHAVRADPEVAATPCLEYAVRVDEWRAGGSPGDGPPVIRR